MKLTDQEVLDALKTVLSCASEHNHDFYQLDIGSPIYIDDCYDEAVLIEELRVFADRVAAKKD